MAGAKYGRESEAAAATPELAEAWEEAQRLNTAEWLSATTAHYVPVESIRIDETVFSREKLDEDAVQRYMTAFDDLPPMVLQGDTFKLITGRLRYEAVRRLERPVVKVIEMKAQDGDLWELAFKSNLEHGLPVTHRERMAAARRCLDVHPDWSDGKVAEWAGVDRSTVFRWRDGRSAPAPEPGLPITQIVEQPPRIGRDGRVRGATQNKGGGEPAAPPPPADPEWWDKVERDRVNQQAVAVGLAAAAEAESLITTHAVPELTGAGPNVDAFDLGEEGSFDVSYQPDPFADLVRSVAREEADARADAVPRELQQAALAEALMLQSWLARYITRLQESIVGLVSPGHQ